MRPLPLSAFRLSFLCTVLCISVSAPSLVRAEVHRCNENGRVVYSDTPCPITVGEAQAAQAKAAEKARLPWEGLSAGMSVEEVQKHVPGLEAREGSSLFDGARSMLGKRTTIAGVDLAVDYFFVAGRLVQVNANSAEDARNELTHRNFERLYNDFKSRYGEESERDIKDRRSGLSGSSTWSNGARVGMTPVTAQTSLLTSGIRLRR